MLTIELAKEFSSTPGGRFKSMGPNSGEEFREILRKALARRPPQDVVVILDGAEGYGSSFLEEAFGGLIRKGLVDAADAFGRLKIVAKTKPYQTYALEAITYMEDAARNLSK